MRLRAVVFDLFQVDVEHLRPAGFHHTAATAELLGIEHEPFRRWWDSTYLERETTPVDLVDVVQRYLPDRRLTSAERDLIDGYIGVARDDVLRQPEPDMVGLVARLAERHQIGVLSNCYEREVRVWPDSPFAPLVDTFVRSCDIGVMKPDPVAYDAVLERLGRSAGDAVYVGNGSSDELLGAAQHGFHRVIHSSVFDRVDGLVTHEEQQRRSAQADAGVETIADLSTAIEQAVELVADDTRRCS